MHVQIVTNLATVLFRAEQSSQRLDDVPHQLQISEHVRLRLPSQVSLLQTPMQLVIQRSFPIFLHSVKPRLVKRHINFQAWNYRICLFWKFALARRA